jgi:hypothetical protein
MGVCAHLVEVQECFSESPGDPDGDVRHKIHSASHHHVRLARGYLVHAYTNTGAQTKLNNYNSTVQYYYTMLLMGLTTCTK